MNFIGFTPRFYCLPPRSEESVEPFERHVKHNLIQVDFKVKKNLMSPEPTGKLAIALKFFREQKNLSQESLAEKAKLSKPAISRFENGHDDPSIASLEAILLALDVTPVVFFDKVRETSNFAESKIPERAKKIV